MRLIYLESGSGARNKIPASVIKKIASEVDIGLIVGGGIRTPQMAENIVKSGATYVVIGSAIEDSTAIAKEFSSAIHYN
jgi:heptaprenylglyceryl phosphate synthase